MSRKFRNIQNIFLVLSILLFLATPVGSLISTALFWDGTCSGFFTFGVPCTWWDYTMINVILISFIAIPLFFVTLLIWVIMVFVELFATRKNKTR